MGHLTISRRARIASQGVLILTIAMAASVAGAQESVAFEGRPVWKVETSAGGTFRDEMRADASFEYQVRVLERNGRYYWASREMKELVRSESGVYVTYHAVDGSGYVRVLRPAFSRPKASTAPAGEEFEPEYMEHLILGFATITYFGTQS